MIMDAESLLVRHRHSGVVLDTNLLLLLMVGSVDETLVKVHRRTSNYTPDDYRLLQRLLQGFREILTTPNVLTELSNLARQVKQPWRAALQKHLKSVIPEMRESFFRSADLVQHDEFHELGLTDCGMLRLGRKGRLVMTSDFAQYRVLLAAECDAVNFNQLREREWN